VAAVAREHGVAARVVGQVGPAGGILEIGLPGRTLRLETARLRAAYYEAIPSRMALAAPVET
jgi:hypothetical protein